MYMWYNMCVCDKYDNDVIMYNYVYNRIGRAEENDNKWWYVLMLIISAVFYIGSLVTIILLYVFFTTVSVNIVALCIFVKNDVVMLL